MPYKDIIFYNNLHNGDIHISRTFVQDIIEKTNLPSTYIHHNYPNLLRTENVTEKDGQYISDSKLIFESENHIYINTWYNINYGHKYYGCTIEALYYNFDIIYKYLKIPLESIENYIPYINFSKLPNEVLSPIDDFFSDKKYDKYVFVSSGPTMSGQSDNKELSGIINNMSLQFPNYLFIGTVKENHKIFSFVDEFDKTDFNYLIYRFN